MNLVKSLSALTAVAALAVSSYAATAIDTDLLVGFKAANSSTDVVIDLGNVNNYSAPGTYVLGNYASVLSSTFGSTWNTVTGTNAVTWGAVADYTDSNGVIPSTAWLSSKWTTAAGESQLGVQHSTSWGSKAQSQINGVYAKSGNVLTGINAAGGYSLGTAVTLSATSLNGWSKNDTSASAFGFTPVNQFNNTVANLGGANFSASDLYLLSNDGTTGSSTLVGTFAVYQNGDVTFTVIPEPSTYAMILGAMTVGFVAVRRRFVKAAV